MNVKRRASTLVIAWFTVIGAVDARTAVAQSEKSKAKAQDPALRHAGRWRVERFEHDGVAGDPETLDSVTRVVEGKRVVWEREGKSFAATSFEVDESRTPFTIDLVPEGGRSKGVVTRGIYRWEASDRLVVCLAAPGAPRPEQFESPKGGKLALWTFVRERSKADEERSDKCRQELDRAGGPEGVDDLALGEPDGAFEAILDFLRGVDPERVVDRGREVGGTERPAGGVGAEAIRRAQDLAALHAAAENHRGEARGPVIAAVG